MLQVEARKRHEYLEAAVSVLDGHLRYFKAGFEALKKLEPFMHQAWFLRPRGSRLGSPTAGPAAGCHRVQAVRSLVQHWGPVFTVTTCASSWSREVNMHSCPPSRWVLNLLSDAQPGGTLRHGGADEDDFRVCMLVLRCLRKLFTLKKRASHS